MTADHDAYGHRPVKLGIAQDDNVLIFSANYLAGNESGPKKLAALVEPTLPEGRELMNRLFFPAWASASALA